MKVALVLPDYHSHIITPPLGIGYLSSYLKSFGHETVLIDAHNRALSPDDIVRMCEGAGLVGISCHSAFILEASLLSRKLKENSHTVVMGGPHPSALPEDTLAVSGADYVVVGEGELALRHIVEALSGGGKPSSFPGVATPDNPMPGRAPMIQNLDDLPFPDWKSMDPRRYRKAPHGAVVRNFPVAPVTTTRGCNFGCKFCSSPNFWGRMVRFRSPENVVEEIEYLVRDFGVREIHFEDDNITLRREHMEAIASLIIKRKLRISWAAPNGVRVESVDRELLRLMKKSGCYMLAFGIESGNQEILDGIDKKITLDTARNAVSMARREGIVTQGFFIFGFPGETPDTIRETVAFARSIPLDRAQFLLLDILPGSALWDEITAQGDWKPDWSAMSFHQSTWTPGTITPDELRKLRAWAFKSFYFRPRQAYYLIKYLKISQIGYIISRMKDYAVLPS
jgi:radical SAM superfamily enzyme YgiQ (UPF0313 family)